MKDYIIGLRERDVLSWLLNTLKLRVSKARWLNLNYLHECMLMWYWYAEYPYPYAVHECYDVYRLLHDTRGSVLGTRSGDLRIVLTGDSA